MRQTAFTWDKKYLQLRQKAIPLSSIEVREAEDKHLQRLVFALCQGGGPFDAINYDPSDLYDFFPLVGVADEYVRVVFSIPAVFNRLHYRFHDGMQFDVNSPMIGRKPIMICSLDIQPINAIPRGER